jgi:Cof subfamily protein (haloacid dehalogenase superfamily)
VTQTYKMIAIDLDGTLLSPAGEVTKRTRDAVHKALAAGMLVCFATGRNWTESRTVIEAVEHYASAVFAGGAMVVDTERDVTLHRMMMDPALAVELCRCFEADGHAVLALQDTVAAGVDYLVTGEAALNEATTMWMGITHAKVRRVPRLGEYDHRHTIRVGIVASREEVQRSTRRLDETFGDRIVHQSLYVPTYGVEVLEVFDPAVNKWQGILHVARHHGIEPAEIIAIGDDVNDIPMLTSAGLGVAMGNARPEIKALAKKVIGANTEEGLARFLEELVEQHKVEPLAEADNQITPERESRRREDCERIRRL